MWKPLLCSQRSAGLSCASSVMILNLRKAAFSQLMMGRVSIQKRKTSYHSVTWAFLSLPIFCVLIALSWFHLVILGVSDVWNGCPNITHCPDTSFFSLSRCNASVLSTVFTVVQTVSHPCTGDKIWGSTEVGAGGFWALSAFHTDIQPSRHLSIGFKNWFVLKSCFRHLLEKEVVLR